jgi:hypothetical protein
LDFPGYSGGDSFESIDWNDWFEKFEESNLALLVQDATAEGERSNFNKLVSRSGESSKSENQRTQQQSRSVLFWRELIDENSSRSRCRKGKAHAVLH